jgi:hypothetical protein
MIGLREEGKEGGREGGREGGTDENIRTMGNWRIKGASYTNT